MLTKNFNKIGGTEYRVKSQVRGYGFFIKYILSDEFKKIFKNNDKEIDLAWKKYVEEEGVYKYKKGNINRFKMLLGRIKNSMPIIFEKEDGYVLNKEFNLDKPFNSFLLFLQKYFNKNTNLPFKHLLEFMYNNPAKNNATKLAYAFSCFDGQESFEELYDMNIFEELAKRSIQNNEDYFKFKKKISNLDAIKEIVNMKKLSKIITPLDLLKYNYQYKKDKHLKPIFFKKHQKYNVAKLVVYINNINYNNLIFNLWVQRHKRTLDKDYKDLFFRWMSDLQLSKASSTKNNYFSNDKIIKMGNLYYVNITNKNFYYPYSKEIVYKYLDSISKSDFSFKIHDDELVNVGNSVIAEYFVNLYFCYKFDINPKDMKKYVNTKMTYDLYPLFTAPGGVPDMSYRKDDNTVINIETTIHKTLRQVENNEIFPCVDHFKENIKNIDNGSLIFVSLINKPRLKERFERQFNGEVNIKNKNLFITTFNNLVSDTNKSFNFFNVRHN